MLAWNAFLSQLEKELGSHIIEEWLKPLRIVRFDAANLYLEAENSFQIHWFEEHIRPRLKKEFLNNNLRPISIHLQNAPNKTRKSPLINPSVSTNYKIKSDPLETDFTFDHFFSSDANLIAYKLLKELNSPTLSSNTFFNPLFIYGPKGAGKTHLLMAAAHSLQQKNRVFFIQAETFTEHVVQAIRLGAMQTFREIYRDIDVLIVDNVHLLAKKSATQEEFFHTFNTLHTVNKQIILSSFLPPSELSDIEPRLISRFEWGLVSSLKPFEDKKKILSLKAKLWNLSIHPAALDFLLENIPSNSIQALQALALRAHSVHIDPPLAQKLLADFLSEEKNEKVTPERILKTLACHFGITVEEILGKSQTRECALPRQIAMYLCREKLHMPFQAIGQLFQRDHSTVMGNVKQIQQGIEHKKQDLIQAMRSCERDFFI